MMNKYLFQFVGVLKARDHEKSDFKAFPGNQGREKSIGIMDKRIVLLP